MKKCLATAALCTLCMAGIWAQGTAFTYQGRLMENGTPFNGTIELEATLWDAATNGTPIKPLRPVTRTVDVSNGLFSVSLDFSKGAFTGAQRWLQIDLRTSPDPTPFTTLWPRQKITATPHAMVAEHLTGRITEDGLFGFYTNQVLFDNPQNYFAGDGSDLLNLNASQLTSGTVPSAALGNAWQIGGNAGTTPGTHFLGTTDNQPLELKVNGFRGLRLEPHNSGLPTVIGGAANNQVAGVAAAFIGGGYDNRIQSGADVSAILGGYFNTIQHNGAYGVVLGGRLNSAGRFGLAAGHNAKANHQGAFVWADSGNDEFASGATNEFAIRASGGARFVTGGAGMTLDGQPVLSGLVEAGQLAPGAVSQLGTPDGSQTGAVQVINGGLVGIGTNAPGAGLHITASASFLAPSVLFQVGDGTGSYTNLSHIQGLAVSGNVLAIAAVFDDAITLVDISNPASPVVLSQLWGPGSLTNFGGASTLAFSGNLIAVSGLFEDVVTLVNVSNPSNPVKVTELRDGVGGFQDLSGSAPMGMTGSLLAIGSSRDSAVTLVDVSNPANPVLRSVIKDGQGGFNSLTNLRALALRGNLLAIAAPEENAITLVDVSNPAAPVLRAVISDDAGGFNELRGVIDVSLSGNLLAITAFTDNAVTFVDVSNPSSPQLRGVIKDGTGGYDALGGAYLAELSGNTFAVWSLIDDAATLVDVSDPAHPALRTVFRKGIGGISHLANLGAITVTGSVLVVADFDTLSLLATAPAEAGLVVADRVGIGTTMPGAALHVVGNVIVEDAATMELRSEHIALGLRSIASGDYSIAMGFNSSATGLVATAMGSDTTAGGGYSTAMGFGTRASGHVSTAMGNGSQASGFTATAMGFTSHASGDYSFAAGRNARAEHTGTFVWADSASAPFASTSSNQFLIRARGGVGIGTTSPVSLLDVEGIGTTNGGVLGFPEVMGRFRRAGASHTAVSIDAETGRDSVLYLAENGTTRWGIRHDADQGHELDIRYSITPATSIEALKLTTNGNLIVAGTINGIIASNAIASGQILDGSVAAVDINATSFSTTFWKTDGNAGTTAGTHFVGTTDNQPLEFHANGLRALRLEPNVNGAPNMVGGAAVNFVTPGRRGAVIGGGGAVTWGSPPVVSNSVAADFGTIGGGAGNSIGDDAFISTIGGGDFNRIRPSSHYGAIGGGEVNTIQTNADWATIGGGAFNVIQNGGHFGTIPGGRENSATNYGFAAGRRAKANHIGAFVWGDSSNADFASTDDNQFLIRAGGGVGIGTPSPQAGLHLYATNNPTVMRIQSAGFPGFGRLEFMSDPQGSGNEWRPGFIQSTDNGNFTGGLAFFVNGSEHQNRINSNEVMRLVNGRVGVNNTNPLHRLHVGVTRGTNAFNTSTNAIVIENAIEDGRATFLALAGIGGPDSSNRVELQMEAVESLRRGIIGTTTEHPVHLRVGNSDLMVLATNRFVGIGTAAPANLLMVEGVGTTNGGVLGFPEVVGRFKRTGASHSAVSIDAETGRDSVLYLAENGAARWGIRHDADQDHELDIRYLITPATSIEALKLSTNGTLTTFGPVNPPSDRNVKMAFQPISVRQILEKVAALPLNTWAYTNSSAIRHIGPVAQDFHAAFGVGTDDKHIATVDADGVALAAIQGLNEKLNEKEAEIQSLKQRLANLEKLITKGNGP